MDEQQQEKDEMKALLEEKAALEAKLADSEKQANERYMTAETARMKAEAESNALKTVFEASRTGNTTTVTDEQWKALEEQTGMSRQAFQAQAQVSQQQIEIAKKELGGKLKDAEDKALKAHERLEKLLGERSTEKVTQTFYETKPSLLRYKKEVNEFLGMFPESEKTDPEKLQKILLNAETFVRGKVGGSLKITPGGSPRLGGSGEGEGDDTTPGEIDFTGLETETQIRTIRDRKALLDNDLVEKKEKLLDRFASSSKHGVVYSAEVEWAEANKK